MQLSIKKEKIKSILYNIWMNVQHLTKIYLLIIFAHMNTKKLFSLVSYNFFCWACTYLFFATIFWLENPLNTIRHQLKFLRETKFKLIAINFFCYEKKFLWKIYAKTQSFSNRIFLLQMIEKLRKKFLSNTIFCWSNFIESSYEFFSLKIFDALKILNFI